MPGGLTKNRSFGGVSCLCLQKMCAVVGSVMSSVTALSLKVQIAYEFCNLRRQYVCWPGRNSIQIEHHVWWMTLKGGYQWKVLKMWLDENLCKDFFLHWLGKLDLNRLLEQIWPNWICRGFSSDIVRDYALQNLASDNFLPFPKLRNNFSCSWERC
jgi:hypothetical protein